MSKELPTTNHDYRNSVKYANAKQKEKENPYYRFCKSSPENYTIDAGCCAVRAICTAEEVTFKQAEEELLDHLSKIGYGFYAYNDVDYMTTHYPKTSYKAVKGQKRMNGRMFAKMHPTGNYVLNMAGHLTACVDGVILDTWDCTNHCVYASWEVRAP